MCRLKLQKKKTKITNQELKKTKIMKEQIKGIKVTI